MFQHEFLYSYSGLSLTILNLSYRIKLFFTTQKGVKLDLMKHVFKNSFHIVDHTILHAVELHSIINCCRWQYGSEPVRDRQHNIDYLYLLQTLCMLYRQQTRQKVAIHSEAYASELPNSSMGITITLISMQRVKHVLTI